MSFLSLVLLFKMAGTLVLLSGPFLLLPSSRLLALSGMPEGPAIIPTQYRLMGVAYLALFVAYGTGFVTAQQGVFPTGIVLMGLVSNVGGALAMVMTGSVKRSAAARITFVFISLVAVGLIVSTALGDGAVQPIF